MSDSDTPRESVQLLARSTSLDEQPQRRRESENHDDGDTEDTLTDIESVLSSQSHNRKSTERTRLLIREKIAPSDSNSTGSSTTGLETRQKENILRIWNLEVVVLVLALSLFIAFCLFLAIFNKQPVPNWGSTITLNALIAILATILRASLGYVAFEILAQLKWTWISARFRPMRDVQHFDKASRGLTGAVGLLPVIQFRQPLALCAVIIAVLSLAIGQFLQQATQTAPCQRIVKHSPNPASTASIVIANRPIDWLYIQDETSTFRVNKNIKPLC